MTAAMTPALDPASFDAAVVALVLLSALMHAAWNAVVKLGDDRLLALAVIKMPTMLVAAATFAFVAPPAPASWPYLLGSVTISTAYFYFLIKAYHAGDLSLAYPIARGIAPLGVLVLSLLFVGETPGPLGIAGVLIVSVGILWLGFRRAPSREHVATMLWASGVGATIAAYTLMDGIGSRLSGSPIGYAAALNVLTAVPLLTIAFARRGAAVFQALKRDWGRGLAGGTMMFAAYAIAIYALTLAPMAVVAALRETGVIFAAVIGTLFLREGFGARRIAAATTVAAGIALLVFSR
jgi:drug/metabolite transporter (DMT)-like permease